MGGVPPMHRNVPSMYQSVISLQCSLVQHQCCKKFTTSCQCDAGVTAWCSTNIATLYHKCFNVSLLHGASTWCIAVVWVHNPPSYPLATDQLSPRCILPIFCIFSSNLRIHTFVNSPILYTVGISVHNMKVYNV